MKTLLATSIGPGKEYVCRSLSETLRAFESQCDSVVFWDGIDKRPELFPSATRHVQLAEPRRPYTHLIYRIARMRAETRKYFLRGDWERLWFVDGDILPPPDALERLEAWNAPIASGVYPIRLNTQNAVLPFAGRLRDNGMLFYNLKCLPENYEDMEIIGGGMGCALISRETLVATRFKLRDLPAFGEDYEFCESSGRRVRVDWGVSCGHALNERCFITARIEPPVDGAVWEDFPSFVSNYQGVWSRGVLRADLDAAQLETLGPGFIKGRFHPIRTEFFEI